MARDHGAAAETLGEIESAADRLGEWLQKNLLAVVGAIVALLVIAGIAAWVVSSRQSREQEASTQLATTRADYLSAMGVGPDALEVPQLANPEAAAQIAAEYRGRFDEIAETYAGTVAGTLAGLESARLAADAGQGDEALVRLEETLVEAPSGDALRGLVLQRLAQRLEAAERWDEAASRYEQAGGLGGFPLRGLALADAARCRVLAGDPEAALALYERIARELPELELPAHLRAQHLELKAAAG